MTTTAHVNHAAQGLVDRLERLDAVDPVAKPIGKVIRDTVPPGTLKDVLSGVPIGHALHPLLTDLPIGTWTSALLLDLLGGERSRPAADRLVGFGIACTVPAVITGLTEWGDSEVGSPAARRVGLVHAASNLTATALFSASLAARVGGARSKGKLLALAGAGAPGAGGWLGGHLSYAQGLGVDQTAFEEAAEDWTEALPDAELGEGDLRCIAAGGVDVLVARVGGELHAMANRCSHRGGPLHEGKLDDGCVTCPWHGSMFRLADGSVERGPAAYPQPSWRVRVQDGTIQVAPPEG